jgi:hypothetical protein
MAKTLVLSVSAVAALGILIGVAAMLRAEDPPEALPRRSGPIPAAPAAPMAALVPVEAPDPELIKRVDEMEGRLNQLLKRRDELEKSNELIRKEMKEVQTVQGLKANAPMFVAGLAAKIGGATDTQKDALTDIWVKWHKEDNLGGAWRTEDEAETRRRLQDREAELRALLSAEQQAKLQSAATARIKTLWWRVAGDLANDLGYPVTAVSRQEENSSINKVLGLMGSTPEAPSTMMLSGAYSRDYSSLRRLAAERVRPQLPPDDSKRLQDPTPEQTRRAIAGSWHYDWQ